MSVSEPTDSGSEKTIAPKKPQGFRVRLQKAQASPAVDAPPPDDTVERLKARIAILEHQITWAQHQASPGRQGGKFTLLRGDLHYGDRAHMLRCARQLQEKSILLMQQYQPEEIVVIENGDSVAGRGIYREQQMDSVLTRTEDQVQMASMKIKDFDAAVKSALPNAKVSWKFIRGNHDHNMAEPLSPYLAMTVALLGVNAVYCGDSAVINLSASGTYHSYFEHGYGFSQISPSSPRWIADVKDRLIRYSRKYYGDQRIRRVAHSHVHWFSLSQERIMDVFFDTTGGTQRNERVMLGKNSRPVGWIAYVSPGGLKDSILAPIGIVPDMSLVEEEIEDPYLFNRNMKDCSDALLRYTEAMSSLGLIDHQEPLGR